MQLTNNNNLINTIYNDENYIVNNLFQKLNLNENYDENTMETDSEFSIKNNYKTA